MATTKDNAATATGVPSPAPNVATTTVTEKPSNNTLGVAGGNINKHTDDTVATGSVPRQQQKGDNGTAANVGHNGAPVPATATAVATANLMTPTSPPYPPYYIDPAHYDRHHHPNGGFDESSSYTYVYPLSPQFSVQYYSELGYQSYPGSPALHPQSPPVNPTSPPFSPTFQYQHHQPSSGITLSPPTHAYVLPPHHHHHHQQHHFPPLHISSPVLTGTASVPGSPPHQYIQPLPGSYSMSTDQRHKRHHSHQTQEEVINYHSHNVYVRGLSSTTTDESFLELCRV